MKKRSVCIIGGGLAGCECARKLAQNGCTVVLYEMRPKLRSPAHTGDGLAELVCSNSLRSMEPDSAVGRLKIEMAALDSLIMEAAEHTAVPAGKALAVDREQFSIYITDAVQSDSRITVAREEIPDLNDPRLANFDAVVVAAGPLASDALGRSLAQIAGSEHLYFYDAIAPIIATDSVDMSIAFWGSRYNPDEHDYLNCPMTEEEYTVFHSAMLEAEIVTPREFEKEKHFEGCLPIETLASRGFLTPAYGPLKPVGFTDPRTGKRPFALLQLRPENTHKTAVNLVGCQTKMTYPEQKRVFRLIPGLEKAEFLRYGSIHRNTFINAPGVLNDDMELLNKPGVYLAGQISGVEGYVESAAHGLWVGMVVSARLKNIPISPPPRETALGALLSHLRPETQVSKHFQPSNVNFGLMPPLQCRVRKKDRKPLYAERAESFFTAWMKEQNAEPQNTAACA